MTSTDLPPIQDASGQQLAKALIVALVVALVILVVAVLPAEYGLDPLGSGRALGLLHDSAVISEPAPPPTLEAALSPTPVGPSTQYGTGYRVDRATFKLGPYEFIEYKYRLVQGANMIFSWHATAPVTHDFHGAPDGQGPEAEVTIDKQTKSHAAGALSAPFTGMHGWYWENPGGDPVTIELNAAGFFATGHERRSSGARRTHELSEPGAAGVVPEIKP